MSKYSNREVNGAQPPEAAAFLRQGSFFQKKQGSFLKSDGLEVARAHSIVDPTGYNSTDYYYYQGGQPAHGVSNVRRKDCRLGTTYLRTT